MSMKIPCSFQVRITGSCATFRTGLWRRPDVPQCLEASALKTFGRQGNTIQKLGQSSPIFTQSWILVDTYLGSFCKTWQHVRTLPSVPEYSRFPLRTRKGLTVKTVRAFGQAVRTWSCFVNNRAILERRSQKTVLMRLSSFRTLHS